MTVKVFSVLVMCALLGGCATNTHRGDSYEGPSAGYPPPPDTRPAPPVRYPAPPPQQIEQARPPAPVYRPPQVEPRPKRKEVRTANLAGYCKQRGYSGSGRNRSGTPICVLTRMGFNTTYVAKTASINFADVCRRQFRTSEYSVSRGRVSCIRYVD